jgi:hypothetical protein
MKLDDVPGRDISPESLSEAPSTIQKRAMRAAVPQIGPRERDGDDGQ